MQQVNAALSFILRTFDERHLCIFGTWSPQLSMEQGSRTGIIHPTFVSSVNSHILF